MAKGRIDGNKILVTGFTTTTSTTVNKEEIYHVVVSGTSTADVSSGVPVTSNMAVVRREKFASITLSTITKVSDLCSSATITTKNIKEDSLSIVGLPGFVSDYSIKKTGDERYSLWESNDYDYTPIEKEMIDNIRNSQNQ